MYWKQFSLLLLFSLAGTAAHADTTTYNINVMANGASVTGTITTDGKSGVLTTDDILGFTLNFVSGGYTNSIVNKNAKILGSDLSATDAGLFYDFTNNVTANYAAFSSDLTGKQDFLCFTGGDNCSGSFQNAAVIQANGGLFGTTLTGLQQIAALPGVTPPSSAVTPEPSSLALLGTGLVGLYGAARRRIA